MWFDSLFGRFQSLSLWKKKKKVIFFLCFAFTIFSIAESFDGMGMKTIQNEERIFEITSTIAAVQSSMYPCTVHRVPWWRMEMIAKVLIYSIGTHLIESNNSMRCVRIAIW